MKKKIGKVKKNKKKQCKILICWPIDSWSPVVDRNLDLCSANHVNMTRQYADDMLVLHGEQNR